MRIVIVSAFYSAGMGYSENCLPKALASLGHEVHVITSNFNVYGNLPGYKETYEGFLGPADQGTGQFTIDGYSVHRLPSKNMFGYVYIKGMHKLLRKIRPDIVQVTEIASVNTFRLALIKLQMGFRLFTETHQHMSVIKPYMKPDVSGFFMKKLAYRVTRTLPSYLTSFLIEKCYAIAPDCVTVANVYYGVPLGKIKLQSLGTDTELFRPAVTDEEMAKKQHSRKNFGFKDDAVICIYSGRFSKEKNPLLLAQAITKLAGSGYPFYGLFIGEGVQHDEIKSHERTVVLPFMKHVELAEYYKLADIASWPMQESMSMLDAAASGLPLVVSDTIGEKDRIDGNGKMYKEGDVDALADALMTLASRDTRLGLGHEGRRKMLTDYSWENVAKMMEADYIIATGRGETKLN